MAAKNIVLGQRVDRAKTVRSRELRREMTVSERILWRALRDRRLGGLRFRRQQIVDGPVHEEQVDYDRERDEALAARGLRTLRIPNDEIQRDLAGILERILAIAAKPSR